MPVGSVSKAEFWERKEKKITGEGLPSLSRIVRLNGRPGFGQLLFVPRRMIDTQGQMRGSVETTSLSLGFAITTDVRAFNPIRLPAHNMQIRIQCPLIILLYTGKEQGRILDGVF